MKVKVAIMKAGLLYRKILKTFLFSGMQCKYVAESELPEMISRKRLSSRKLVTGTKRLSLKIS